MKARMTGPEIQNVRNAFGMSQEAFASVLAVHPGTVRRWESTNQEVSVDGVAAGVLLLARERLKQRHAQPEELRQAGDDVTQQLLAAGALAALAVLIYFLTRKK